MREYQFPLKFEYQYKDKTDNDFTNDLVDLKNTKAFIKYVSPFYNVIFQNNSQFQGWKIHLSPILSEYNSVLRKRYRLNLYLIFVIICSCLIKTWRRLNSENI